ncbi:MAG TPA: 5-methyltetrahydropteroyltriglutamate--homocysteine S-methyltransferase, partial [Thermomicrobiales bacterium]|nr:5-methyltetrahydropteroyltriglutamate--homocysteine S-methyltransferase [Thermomicrobiales bacterium]
ATIPGYPRIGKRREMKRALEGFWSGKRTAAELEETAAAVRRANWDAEIAAGLDLVPVNDFSFYDHVLDTCALVGAMPPRFGWTGGRVDLDLLFAMARGGAGADAARAMELTKWFDTNYHYLVPEFSTDQTFRLSSEKPFAELAEARALGISAKPVLLGPITFLLLGKMTGGDHGVSALSLLDALLPVYVETIQRLASSGAEWIQLDEPALVLDLTVDHLTALERAYAVLAETKGAAKLLLQTAFGHVGEAYSTLTSLAVDGVGLDFVRGPQNLDFISQHGFPAGKFLAAGVVDGRNVWTNDLAASLDLLGRIQEHVPSERLMISASNSLQHVPYDVELEDDLPAEVRPWLAFAEQKLAEIVTLTRAVNDGEAAVAAELAANRDTVQSAAASPLRRNAKVRQRLAELPADADRRALPYAERAQRQRQRLNLPPLPTTTIGSFPQTGEIRSARKAADAGAISHEEYETFLEGEIANVVERQESLGLDVLVHGEPERNDMVQYFGEQLDGFAFTRHGWVQSYGSRYVRPPIIYGDIARPHPMTLRWATYAQGLTGRPVKGMLTGPVTILNWSFVRDDQPRQETCRQISLAIRDEVADLDAAGIAIIQIDEPALREGLPLRHSDQLDYLRWAVECFRLAAAGARPETQIQTHMCYSEFGEIFTEIDALDADVLLIEHARSDQELLDVFRREGYDKGIGPGVYDVHSPRVPDVPELTAQLQAILTVLQPERVWVNPDCGLKTRKPDEVWPALEHMVEAAREVRSTLGVGSLGR